MRYVTHTPVGVQHIDTDRDDREAAAVAIWGVDYLTAEHAGRVRRALRVLWDDTSSDEVRQIAADYLGVIPDDGS